MKRWLSRALLFLALLCITLSCFAQARPLPSVLWGVTLDDVTSYQDEATSLSLLPYKPIARVNFDPGTTPSDYADALNSIYPVSYVMGQILDSYSVRNISVSGYLSRTQRYYSGLKARVDLWEIGNEVNGEWLGSTSSVVQKIYGAWKYVKGQGGKTALTLYYNQDCWSLASHEMFTWASANIPSDMKKGLDYVLVSFYPYDCNNIQPDWANVYARLHAMFPNSKLGFGEVGVSDDSVDDSVKAQLVNQFYGMGQQVPQYVGGYFWWYYAEERLMFKHKINATAHFV